MTRKVLAQIGDYLCIPLPDSRFAYGQYLYRHPLYATLIRITDIVSDKELPLESVVSAGDLFPPVFVGINVPLRQKLWKIMGNVPLTNFEFPLFRIRQGINYEAGTFDDWLLWNGDQYSRLGTLPPEYTKLEYLGSWSSDALERRIATGVNEPYGSMR